MFQAMRGARGALVVVAAIAAMLLASCGGASNANGPDSPPNAAAQACSPNNPWRADATGPTTTGSLTIEKAWLRNYVDDTYLWFSDVPSVNPSNREYSDERNVGLSLDNYFNALTNLPQDRFSFAYPTRLWDELINSGSSLGYGIEWQRPDSLAATPRVIRVAYVHAGSPASGAGVLRGDTLVQVDNTSVDAMTEADLLAALYPSTATPRAFRFSRGGVVQPANATLTPVNVTLTTVQAPQVLSIGGQNVGYLLFNDHLATAQQPLIDAFTTMQNAGVTDLVLDLRYNGGGYLYIASQVAYMIAGPARTGSSLFERLQFNTKRSGDNVDFPFGCVLDPGTGNCSSGAALPTLNLGRVFVLSSGDTCSASESIINGLRGIGVDVRLIGNTTCGKPYGFLGQDNCGITYFPIEFKGVNAAGFGDYADGLSPAATDNGTDRVRGCVAADDLSRALGDPQEGQLAAALYMRANNTCPPGATPSREGPLAAGRVAEARVFKPAALTNRNGRMPTR
jgi:C-terminal processing protease CtpA/Prc